MAAQTTGPPTIAARSLRLAVAALRSAQPRRTFATTLHVGHLGDRVIAYSVPSGQPLDHGLRTEVAAALLSRALLHSDRPAFWLTRPGEPGSEDIDLDWYAAARSAYGEAGVPLAMAVITKRGWHDPGTDLGRTWKRLRLRS